MDLASKVRTRRHELGLSQEELASKMGYSSRTSINKIENGRPCSQKIIARLAQALNTTPSYLMGWEGKGDELASFHARILKDIPLMEALEDYYRLNKKNQKIVRDLIHSMAESEA